MSEMLTKAEVFARLRASIAAEPSQRAWCARHEVSETHLSEVLNGKRTIGDALTIPALGLMQVTRWIPTKRKGVQP